MLICYTHTTPKRRGGRGDEDEETRWEAGRQERALWWAVGGGSFSSFRHPLIFCLFLGASCARVPIRESRAQIYLGFAWREGKSQNLMMSQHEFAFRPTDKRCRPTTNDAFTFFSFSFLFLFFFLVFLFWVVPIILYLLAGRQATSNEQRKLPN